MTRNKVEICGVDTAKLPVLTNAEMRELFSEFADETGTICKREIGQWEPKVSSKCDPAIQQSRRVCGRFIPSWLYWFDEGH